MDHQVPDTSDRVAENTASDINERIERETRQRLVYYADRPDEIDRRLAELDAEWDIERALEANAASLGLAGFALAAMGGRRFLLLPCSVSAFLLQHAVQGWCPPIPLMRRLGFRTAREIEHERNALKALRGDFERLAEPGGRYERAHGAFAAARLGASPRLHLP
jgi:hypothetical protein